jgi:hypothetical protein
MRRIAPAVGLFFLAPFVAEYLLGDLTLKLLPAMIVLAPLYGGGALLVREVVRRAGGGWPSVLLLALAYGIFEEAFTTQTLFNPNYLGMNLHLLEPAFVPALGIGAWWTVFVLTLHTVWSITTPILLAEALWPDRAEEPWLSSAGLAITIILFLFGSAASTLMSYKRDHYVATTPQFAVSAVACGLVIAIATWLPKPDHERLPGGAPNPWIVGVFSLAMCSAFKAIPKGWGWAAVGAYFLLFAVSIFAISRWSKTASWDGRHRLALGGGATQAYAWHSFFMHPVVGAEGMNPRVSNAVFTLMALILLWIAAHRTSARSPESVAATSAG